MTLCGFTCESPCTYADVNMCECVYVCMHVCECVFVCLF